MDNKNEEEIETHMKQWIAQWKDKLVSYYCEWMRDLTDVALNYVEKPNLSDKHINENENKQIKSQMETMIREQFASCWEYLKNEYFVQKCYNFDITNKQQNRNKLKPTITKTKTKEKKKSKKTNKEKKEAEEEDSDIDIELKPSKKFCFISCSRLFFCLFVCHFLVLIAN